jgi:hypothetical protein
MPGRISHGIDRRREGEEGEKKGGRENFGFEEIPTNSSCLLAFL